MVKSVKNPADANTQSDFNFHLEKILTLVIAAGAGLLIAGCTTPPAKPVKQTYSSFDLPSEHVPPDKAANGLIDFQGVPLDQVLQIYQALSGRTVIRGPLPAVNIIFRSKTPLSRVEALQMLDTVLAQNGIAMVLAGDKAVKAVPASQAVGESPPEITLPWQLLPESGSCMSRTVRVQHFKPSEAVPVLQPLSKLPNSILAIDGEHLLILRDYSANIRQELRLLETLEKDQSKK
jgi:type II secretory pathway component GspD/PulD (secretin)